MLNHFNRLLSVCFVSIYLEIKKRVADESFLLLHYTRKMFLPPPSHPKKYQHLSSGYIALICGGSASSGFAQVIATRTHTTNRLVILLPSFIHHQLYCVCLHLPIVVSVQREGERYHDQFQHRREPRRVCMCSAAGGRRWTHQPAALVFVSQFVGLCTTFRYVWKWAGEWRRVVVFQWLIIVLCLESRL